MEYTDDITEALGILDSLMAYILDELIGEHKNTKDISDFIKTYAECYHEIQLELFCLHK